MTIIRLIPNTTGIVVATLGIPVAAGKLTDPDRFVFGGGVPRFAKATLFWPDGSIRALKVQIDFNCGNGEKEMGFHFQGSGISIPERPIQEVLTSNLSKGNLKEPAVFGIVDPDYLLSTGIIPPSTPAGDNRYDNEYWPSIWKQQAKDLNFLTSGADAWLFDRASTLYKQAVRNGDPEQYREAYLSHEFYISKMEVTGTNTTVADYCVGGFNYGGKATTFQGNGSGCDTKYIYLQPIKLHLALTGDDSWQPQVNGVPALYADTREKMWRNIANLLTAGNNRGGNQINIPVAQPACIARPYTNLGDQFTERNLGYELLALINSYELTLDPAVKTTINNAVNFIHEMAYNNPDMVVHYGYLSHSWRMHEGGGRPWIGTTKDAYTASLTIEVNNVLGDGYKHINYPNEVTIKGAGTFVVASPAVNNGSTWSITLTKPVTVAAGAIVDAGFADTNNKVNLNVNHRTDRAFSPWMRSQVAVVLWQWYQLYPSPIIEKLLLGFGRSIAAYALDGTRINPVTKALIESAFGVTIFNSTLTATTGCSLKVTPYTRYVASALMATAEMNRPFAAFSFGAYSFSDQHIPECLFQIALAIKFESDPEKKAALESVASDMCEWFNNAPCTSVVVGHGQVPRIINWQNFVDPWGTYSTVMEAPAPLPQPEPVPDPVPDPGPAPIPDPIPDPEPVRPPIKEVEIVARGAAYWKSKVDGVEQSQHSAVHKAIEKGVNLVLSGKTKVTLEQITIFDVSDCFFGGLPCHFGQLFYDIEIE